MFSERRFLCLSSFVDNVTLGHVSGFQFILMHTEYVESNNVASEYENFQTNNQKQQKKSIATLSLKMEMGSSFDTLAKLVRPS